MRFGYAADPGSETVSGQGPGVSLASLTFGTLLNIRAACPTTTVMGGLPLSAEEAWTAYEAWCRRDAVFVAHEPEGCDLLLADWVRRGVISPRLWTDAYLAAFASASGFRLVTFDRDFSRFDGLHLLLLDG